MLLNAIKQMERASRHNASVISLAQGIPFQSSDEHIRQAAIQAIQTGRADQYSDPQGLAELRRAISCSLAEQQMAYEADEVVVTAGAIEGLNAVLHTLVTPERPEVVMPVPVYSAYSRSVTAAGGQVVPVRLDEAHGWRLDITRVRRALSGRTAAILICNPNNPTGSVYGRHELTALARLAAEHDCVLVSDEVYGNMLYGGATLFSPAQLPTYRRHLIRIVSFSKDFALTGWRIGFVQADASRIDELLAVHDTLVNCAPVVSQYAALAALQQSRRILSANRQTYRRHRVLMESYLAALGSRVSYCSPAGAYFFFVRVQGVTDSRAFCLELLKRSGVAVVPGADFGPGGEAHVRLCFGRSAAAIRTGMQRFTEFMEDYHG